MSNAIDTAEGWIGTAFELLQRHERSYIIEDYSRGNINVFSLALFYSSNT